jgi:hypothetical protein
MSSTIVGAAAGASSFSPLVTALMAAVLVGSVVLLRALRRRVDPEHFSRRGTTEPTERPARR